MSRDIVSEPDAEEMGGKKGRRKNNIPPLTKRQILYIQWNLLEAPKAHRKSIRYFVARWKVDKETVMRARDGEYDWFVKYG